MKCGKDTKDQGYTSVSYPVCGAEMGVFESIDYVDGTSSWSGICGECGVRVEEERPERVKVVMRPASAREVIGHD